MKKFLKVLLILVMVIIIGVAGVAMYVKTALPNVGPAEDIKIEQTAERIERGRYLANSVTVCMDCHTQRDFSLYSAPIKKDSLGAGGAKFGKEDGAPGTIYIRNITPYALKGWTDGEIYRAITTGVSKDGDALVPVMPFHNYAKMDPEDIYSIIAYLRSIPEIKNDVPKSQLDFPLNFIVNTLPKKHEPGSMPDTNNSVAYGKYLVNAASCMHCHSKENMDGVIPGTEFAGGNEFKQREGGVSRSANITPEIETGIGKWSREQFINRFKMLADTSYKPAKLQPGDVNTPMPWTMYAQMTEKDLGAIYDYLRTVKPIKNKVQTFERAQKAIAGK